MEHLWIGLVVLCLLLIFAPNIVFNLICNTLQVIFQLSKELCRCICRLYEFIATNPITHKIPGFILQSFRILCGVVWVYIDLPNYIKDWISARDNIDDSVNNPHTSIITSSKDHSTSATSVASSSASSSIRACAGHTVDRSPCKRQKMMPNNDAETWYCRNHERQRQGYG